MDRERGHIGIGELGGLACCLQLPAQFFRLGLRCGNLLGGAGVGLVRLRLELVRGSLGLLKFLCELCGPFAPLNSGGSFCFLYGFFDCLLIPLLDRSDRAVFQVVDMIAQLFFGQLCFLDLIQQAGALLQRLFSLFGVDAKLVQLIRQLGKRQLVPVLDLGQFLFKCGGPLLGSLFVLDCLLQLTGAHVLNIVLLGELLPLPFRDGEKRQSLGNTQISQRWEICFRAEKSELGGAVLFECLYVSGGGGCGKLGLPLQPGEPLTVRQHFLGLLQTAADLNTAKQRDAAPGVYIHTDLCADQLRRPFLGKFFSHALFASL